MIIKLVSYRNLKGRTGEVDLAKATMIVGRNFTGKSTVPDAIKLALLGHHPGLDKTAKAIFALSSGDEMVAMVETDGGAQVGRMWRRSPGGAIAKKDFVPMNWPETPVVLLDANAYFGASDRGKAELLFGAINAVDWKAQLNRIGQKLAEHGFADQPRRDLGIQAFVNAALEVVEKARSESAASAKRYLDTVQGLSALKAKAAVPLDEDVMQRLVKKRLELKAAEGKVGEARRLAQLHSATRTPEESQMDALANKISALARDAKAKREEAARADKYWGDLLKSEACPMCETPGDAWRKNAQARREAIAADLAKELGDIEAEQAKLENELEAGNRRAAGAKSRLKEKDAERLEECEEVVAGLVEEVAKLERSLEDYAQDQADRRRLDEAAKSHEDAKREAELAEAAKKYLLGVKASLSEQLFTPILKTAGAFTKGIFLGPLNFEDGALGMARFVNGQRVFVHHSAFSGTEQAITFAALQAALAATAPIKLVVMDELGRVDAKNKAQLLENVLAALKDGTIDQFVGIDTAPPTVEGFTVVVRK